MNSRHGNRPTGKSSMYFIRKLSVLLLILALLTASVCACDTKVTSAASTPTVTSAGPAETSAAPAQQASPSPSPSDDAEEIPTVSKVTVTFFGDAMTSRGFTWYTGKASASSDLQVVELTATKTHFDSALTFTGTVYPSNNSKDESVHKAMATGLESATTYYYRVGDEDLDIWSDPAVFTTAPAGGAFSFIDISDTQSPGQANKRLIPETIEKALDMCENAGFIINNGDNVDSNFEWEWKSFLTLTKDSLSNITVMPTVGNHEVSKSCFIDHYHLDTPAADTTTGAYYSVTYSNAHFVVLNTNESSASYMSFSTEQIDWMTADINNARSDGAEWIIVVLHMGPYSTGSHADDARIVDTREKFPPLMSALDVDLVLQGHDHVYDRSKPIENGAAVPAETVTEDYNGSPITYLKTPAGPIYMTPATAGTKHYYQNTALTEDYLSLFETLNAPKVGDNNYNTLQTFICFTIDGNKLTATAYQFSPGIDGGTPYIIDQFGILK